MLTQREFESLLERLREEQTESPMVEGKEDLPLNTEGDRAFFIRHIAALANNVEPSYLILGVEDRTWQPVGLFVDSPLRDVDTTQQRMNNILARRLDPPLHVRYRTYELDGTQLGLVAIEGGYAPYVIAIDDQMYGGDRTRGEPEHIYRGAFYVRRGANSVIANRQAEILRIVERARDLQEELEQPDAFLKEAKYLDVQSSDFGRHNLSSQLLELHIRSKEEEPGIADSHAPANSWVAYVAYPVERDCQLDVFALKNKLHPNRRIGRGAEWYRQLPRLVNEMLLKARATSRELRAKAKREPHQAEASEGLVWFLRIEPAGHIEIAGSTELFVERDEGRFFSFVSLIGFFWQFLYLAQAIYRDAGYQGKVEVLLNMIGTRGTRLADFAYSQRGGWASPFSFEYCTRPVEDQCDDHNIQVRQVLSLVVAGDDEIEKVVRSAAAEIGAYYNQDRPRCFDYNTNEFPWRDYSCRYLG